MPRSTLTDNVFSESESSGKSSYGNISTAFARKQWSPIVKNWFSSQHYEMSGTSPIVSSYKVQENYGYDEWVFYDAYATIELSVTANYNNSILSLEAAATFAAPSAMIQTDSPQFRDFYQDKISLSVTVENGEHIYTGAKSNYSSKLLPIYENEIPAAEYEHVNSHWGFGFGVGVGLGFEIPKILAPFHSVKHHIGPEFSYHPAELSTHYSVNDFELSASKPITSWKNKTVGTFHSATMKNCYLMTDNAPYPYDHLNPDKAMHNYFGLPDTLNRPAPIATSALTLQTQQAFLVESSDDLVHAAFELKQDLIGMSIWRGNANHQIRNKAVVNLTCDINVKTNEVNNLTFFPPAQKNIKDNVQQDIKGALQQSPIQTAKWIKIDTYGCPDYCPDTPFKSSNL